MNPNKYIREKYDGKIIHADGVNYIEGMVRDNLYEIFNELGYKVGAEIGVRMGNNAVAMFQRVQDLKLYLIDSWCNYGEYFTQNDDHDLLYCFAAARRRLEDYNGVFIRKFSADAVKEIEDNSLDFVYIVANHSYDYCMMDIIMWTQKVRKGGIVSGHDYRVTRECPGRDRNNCGVDDAVTDYTNFHRISDVYVTTLPSPDQESRPSDTELSWFFVRGEE